MKLLARLEKRLGAFAIPHLTIYIVFFQVCTYILLKAAESRNLERAAELMARLVLDGRQVLHGEVWRVLTFVIIPPQTNPVFFVIAMYLLFLMGTALENQWGVFRYNLYLAIGWVASVAAALALPTGPATNTYVLQSVFLAFAYLYPDFVLLLFFFFPVKVKWLALLTWIIYLIQFSTGKWLDKLLIVAAILNFLLFFHRELWQQAKAGFRRHRNRARIAPPTDDAFNRCTTCGVTEKSNPRMEFRYCAQCAGVLCYCIDHIHVHEHRGKVPEKVQG